MKTLKKQNIILIISFLLILISLLIINTTNKFKPKDNTTNIEVKYAPANLKNTTRVYFSSEVTKTYGNGDCILLENYDSNGNVKYGLIDTGRKITSPNSSTRVKDFLISHGVQELEFVAITHSHGDHNGDAMTVLQNFTVKEIIMKEFDAYWSPDGTQAMYENILTHAIDNNIKVLGVSYLSLTSPTVSPSRTDAFKIKANSAKQNNFTPFYYNNTSDNSIIFNFGSSTIRIFNWEMFDSTGALYTTGVSSTTREITANENNNSIAILLTQGNKKAFFAGDMNNLDKDEENNRIGDEDRIKNEVGKVDFLKLGHHGYNYSNTEDYINVLKPEYVVITNDLGGAYKKISTWLENNNVDYLYTTTDPKSVSLTVTNDKLYLGFETDKSFKNVNGKMIYIPEGESNKFADYHQIAYEIQYQNKEVEVSSWNALKEIIEGESKECKSLDTTKKICYLEHLKIKLKTGGNWNATSKITISEQQQVTLSTSETITITRAIDNTTEPFFLVNGTLNLGIQNMSGTITLNGNKQNVSAETTLINVDTGKLNIYPNMTLSNNMNKTTKRTKNSSTQSYVSYGSAIYATGSIVNMYGGSITNNEELIEYTLTLPKEINHYYSLSSLGTGIYLANNSIFNMSGGTISNNLGTNNSMVLTNDEYTTAKLARGINQLIDGVGIYATTNSILNLTGGSIKNNRAVNNSKATIKKSTNSSITTNIQSLNASIYGVGLYADSSIVNISNGFEISGNKGELHTDITIQSNTSVNSSVTSAIRGTNVYFTGSTIDINNATIKNNTNTKAVTSSNNGSIGSAGTGSISTTDVGGCLDIVSSPEFNINNLTVSGCTSYYGGGIYTSSTNGNIKNSTITNNTSSYGGGIYIAGSSYTHNYENVTISNNTTTEGSGGGVYAQGSVNISGANTKIINNTAYTYGGGLMIKKAGVLYAGEISGNKATTQNGGGVHVDGTFLMSGGTIKNNNAAKYGGGVNHNGANALFNKTGGTITGNTAGTAGNEVYPESLDTTDKNPPVIKVPELSTVYINKNVTVTFNVNDYESNIKDVKVNGTIVNGSNGVYQYIASSNGTYEIKATDESGNTSTEQFTISNIDKTAPTITGVSNNGKYTSVTIKATDNVSIQSTDLYKNNNKISYFLGNKIQEEGSYKIVVKDIAGNSKEVTFTIDRTVEGTEIEVAGISDSWTNNNQTVTLTFPPEVQKVLLNDQEITLSNHKYTFEVTENGTHKLDITDISGNTITKNVNITNIDKELPEISGVIDNSTVTKNTKVTITDNQSGIKKVTVTRDGNAYDVENKKEITFTINGVYRITAEDEVGNVKGVTFTLSKNEEDETHEIVDPPKDPTQGTEESDSDGGTTNPKTGAFASINIILIAIELLIVIRFIILNYKRLYKI